MELYKKYRPDNFDDIIGQDAAVRTLEAAFENDAVPHFILLIGPSGCGKTTLARIIRKKLHCSRHDFIEDAPRKIEDVRVIKRRIHQAPMSGKCRVWLVDECHKLTSDAQDEFLKMLEDTPNHVYFLFATTNPQKLKKTVRGRAREIVVKPLNDKSLSMVLGRVCKEEDVEIDSEVIDKIIENSQGSARNTLVYLDAVVNLTDTEEQLEAIAVQAAEKQAFEIVRALLYNTKTTWKEMVIILKATEGEDVEQIRWLILSCCKTEMLKAGKFANRAFLIIQAFCDNFFDSKQAGLVAACYEVIMGTDD